jgi:hypothetical protein
MYLPVYRDNTKTDKGKKGPGANNASVSATKSRSVDEEPSASQPPTSISSAGQYKGKEKEKTIGLPSPFTSVPRSGAATIPGDGEEVDESMRPEDEEMMEPDMPDDDEGFGEEDGAADQEDVEEEADVEIGGDEELVDKVAVEEAELRKDAMALDEPSGQDDLKV